MRQASGAALVIVAIAALWVYNTGRATAVVAAIKDPNAVQPRASAGGTNTAGGSGSGQTTWADAASCAAHGYATGDWACVFSGGSQVIGNQIPILSDINHAIGDIFGGLFG